MNPELIKKLIIVGAIILLVILFKVLGLDQYLTLTYLKEQQANFARLYAENKVTVIGSYMLIYIIVTALSLPGAAVMTLAGGGLFGLVTGTIMTSPASRIALAGAVLEFAGVA